jgi:vancomycin resistance protein VanW
MTTSTSSAFVPPARVTARPRLSERHPGLYPLAVRVHRARRRLRWLTSGDRWASERTSADLAVRVKRHRSLLLRELGASEMWMQHNKVTNLRLAAARVDRILVRPGETFSFNRVVGNCTRRKGYVEGMRLSNGDAQAGVGGGICQLANLLHWMFLHSPLTVVERSEHSFDPFPDNGRVLPWGVGCSIVYNYVDLVVRNDTDATFQILVSVGERTSRATCARTASWRTPTGCTPATRSSCGTAASTTGATRSGGRSWTVAPASRAARSSSRRTVRW